MKNKIFGLNCVLFGASLITTIVVVCTIVGEGYKGNVVPKDIYHVCLGAILGVMFTGANIYAISKKGKL